MINRTLVASFVALGAIGWMLAPVEASARGGLGAGRGIAFHGGFHRFPVRPAVPVGVVPRRAVTSHLPAHIRPVRFAPVRPHVAAHGRAVRLAPLAHHRRGFGSDFAAAGVSVLYGSSYPVGDAAPPVAAYGPPPDAGSAEPASLAGGFQQGAAYRHICRSAVQMVPSERGGEREITITRCYVVVE